MGVNYLTSLSVLNFKIEMLIPISKNRDEDLMS